MQKIRGGHATGELAVNLDVGGIDHIADAHFAGDRVTALVHALADGSVRMAIDDARRDMHALAINDRCACRNLQARADRREILPSVTSRSAFCNVPCGPEVQMVAP